MNSVQYKLLIREMRREFDELGKRQSSLEDRMHDYEVNQKTDNREFSNMAAEFSSTTAALEKFTEAVKKNPEKIEDRVVDPLLEIVDKMKKKQGIVNKDGLTPEQVVKQIKTRSVVEVLVTVLLAGAFCAFVILKVTGLI